MHSRQLAVSFVRSLRSISLAIAFLGAISSAAFAQVDRAELEGTVTDPSGSVIVSATVNVSRSTLA